MIFHTVLYDSLFLSTKYNYVDYIRAKNLKAER